MSDCIEIIKTNRPNITNSSVKTYCSALRNLSKQLNIPINTGDDISKHWKVIFEHLKGYPLNRRKTTLSAIVVLLDDDKHKDLIEVVRGVMMKNIDEYNEESKTQEMTEKEKENWVSYEDLQKEYSRIEKATSHLLKEEGQLKQKEFDRLQDYILLSILMLIPPMRSSDISYLKLREIDPATDNYKQKNNLIINRYKTMRVYGTRTIKLPDKLNKILNAWALKNPNEWMFINRNKQRMTPTQLMNRLHNIFDKNISTSMIRKIFVTEKLLKDLPDLETLEKVAQEGMGHSLLTSIVKYKKVKPSKK